MLEIRGVRFDAARPAIVVPLTGGDPAELRAQAEAVREAGPDLVEWRVDLAEALAGDLDAQVLVGHQLVDALGGLPLLATIRTRAEGGQAAEEPERHLETLAALVSGGVADLVDVELGSGADAVHRAVTLAHDAGVAVVASNHDVVGTPPRDELLRRLHAMAAAGADLCKIAVTPHDAGDVLALLGATWDASRELDRPVIAVSMGRLGVVSRLAGGVFGSVATFASVGRGSAPGQLDVATVRAALVAVHGDGAA